MFDKHAMIYLRFMLALAGLVLMLAASGAHAFTITPQNVTGVPGSKVDVVFDFDFASTTPVSSFDFTWTFDPTRLSFVDGSILFGGKNLDGTGDWASSGLLLGPISNPDNVSLFWFGGPVDLSGINSLLISFNLMNDFPRGATTSVELTGSIEVTGSNPDLISSSANVKTDASTVPVPPTTLLILPGLAILAISRVRRLV